MIRNQNFGKLSESTPRALFYIISHFFYKFFILNGKDNGICPTPYDFTFHSVKLENQK